MHEEAAAVAEKTADKGKRDNLYASGRAMVTSKERERAGEQNAQVAKKKREAMRDL